MHVYKSSKQKRDYSPFFFLWELRLRCLRTKQMSSRLCWHLVSAQRNSTAPMALTVSTTLTRWQTHTTQNLYRLLLLFFTPKNPLIP